MTTTRRYGDWRKLTVYLQGQNGTQLSLTDDRMQEITGSIDESKPYDVDFTDPNYCIRRRARDAGFSVEYDGAEKSVKIFTREATDVSEA